MNSAALGAPCPGFDCVWLIRSRGRCRSIPRRFSESTPPGHAGVIAALHRAALETDGVTDPAVRVAVFAGGSAPAAAEGYLAMVRDQSFRISQGAVDALRSAGVSEDAIFELTVAAALGAADRQHRAGLDLLEGD